jgi:hypothetical protein
MDYGSVLMDMLLGSMELDPGQGTIRYSRCTSLRLITYFSIIYECVSIQTGAAHGHLMVTNH